MKISIIIPTYGRPENLKNVFNSLESQDCKDFEVVIVEGLDLEKTKNFLRKNKTSFPIKAIKQSGRGLVNAVNEGVEHAKGSIVIRTDDDVVFSKSWLKLIKETFAMSDKVGGVSGPTIIPPDRLDNRELFYYLGKFVNPPNLFWKIIGKIYLSLVLDNQPFRVGKICKSGNFSPGSNYSSCLDLKEPVEVDYLEACNYAVRKDLVKKVGGFDEGYVGIGDWHEPDLCFRIRKLGYKLYFNPEARLNHMLSRGGVFTARSQTFCRSYNFIRFYFKHIKPDSLEKIVKFSFWLLFMNTHFIYSFVKTRNPNQLTGIWGTIKGLTENIFKF